MTWGEYFNVPREYNEMHKRKQKEKQRSPGIFSQREHSEGTTRKSTRAIN